jgi:signal transduction histidine kinase
MIRQSASAFRRLTRRPHARDTALACGLLAVCGWVNDPSVLLERPTVDLFGAGRGVQAVLWWTATIGLATTVALRRRRPLPMLVAGSACAAVHLAQSVPPTVIEVGVLVLLYTVATRHRPTISLGTLAGLLLLLAGWSGYHTLAGRPVPGVPVLALHVVHRPDPAMGQDGSNGPIKRPYPWSGLVVLGSALVAAWGVGCGVRGRRAYVEQLRARTRDLERDRDQRAALAAAAERERLSRELHDVVAHGLSVIVIQAQGAAAALDDPLDDADEARTALDAIVTTGRDSLAEMRRVLDAVGEMDDAWHPQPGLGHLPALIARVRRAGTPVRLRVQGTPTTLASAVDLSAYRIVQEALTNTMKHTGTTGAQADVLVSYREREIGIEVSDNGPGPAATDGSDTGRPGSGLRGMRERTRLLGGRFAAGPGRDGGFVVRADLPVEDRHA